MSDLLEVSVLEQSYMADTRTIHYEMVAYILNPEFSFVCTRNNVIVGFVKSATSAGPLSVSIDALCVSPNHRSRGIGRKLLEYSVSAIMSSKAHRVRRIELFVLPANRRAIRLYESAGFRIRREIPNAYLDGSPAFYMTLEEAPLA